MRLLTEIDPVNYAQLLGSECPGCTAENNLNQINPAPGRRMVFVGLGGSGCITLNRIKKWVVEHMMPGWEQYIGFLVLDCDRWDMEHSRFLIEQELVPAAAPGMGAVMHAPAESWPGAWRFIAAEDQIRSIPIMDDFSSQRSRLKAKLMFRCPAPGRPAPDQNFLLRLHSLVFAGLRPDIGGPDPIEVYVFAGLSGGFGSAIAPETAALIRKALSGRDVHIHGVFYTPDVYFPMDPAGRDVLAANGFAALRELNYIQELKFRPGERLSIPVSDPANGFCLHILGEDAGYDTLTLMGAEAHQGRWMKETAIRTAVDQMISALLDHAPHPRSGIIPPAPMQPGRHYPAAMDFAAADAVKVVDCPEIAWAWQTARLCEAAGFRPISDQERADRIAAGANFLPFLGRNQYLPAGEVTQRSEGMLHSLLSFMRQYQTVDFRYADVIPGGAPTWEAIRDGYADDMGIRSITAGFENHILSTATQDLTSAVQEEFRIFRNMAKQYAEDHGPLAFVNLYMGNAIPGANGAWPKGIREMLHMLQDDFNPTYGNPMIWPRAEELWDQCRTLAGEIMDRGSGLTGRILMSMGRGEELAARWTYAYDHAVNARINEQRRQMMLGRNGILRRHFLEPAEKLMEQMYALGNVLESMTEISSYQARPLEDFHRFSHWAAARGNGTVWALCPETYAVVIDELQSCVNQVNPQWFRQGVLTAFWDNPEQWLECPDSVVRWHNTPRLADPGNPIPARQFFDGTVLNLVGRCRISLTDLILRAVPRGINLNQILDMALRELRRRQNPRFSTADAHHRTCRVLYPQDLDFRIGPGTSAVLSGIAQNVLGNVVCLPTADLMGLRLMIMDLGLEARQAADIRPWRDDYRHRLHFMGNGLHGFGPGQAPDWDGGFPWDVFPDLVDDPDPQSADQTERDRVRDLRCRAQELSLLRKQESWGWEVCWMDMSGQEDAVFHMLDTMEPEELFRRLGTSDWSWMDFEHLMKPLRMPGFGVYDRPAETEAEAWQKAEQLLRIFPGIRKQLTGQTLRMKEWLDTWHERHPAE